ncbi:MAG TPA: hypothetical protein PKC69_16215, partial [Chitinophagaceae bacterium]|nr:hypothetical protein [Chitinophagaceae bacterium]
PVFIGYGLKTGQGFYPGPNYFYQPRAFNFKLLQIKPPHSENRVYFSSGYKDIVAIFKLLP